MTEHILNDILLIHDMTYFKWSTINSW
jgi:hypothetical protein